MKILIINGPNLNLLGRREQHIYGNQSFEDYFVQLQQKFPTAELTYYQNNSEGKLLDKLHELGFTYDGIVLNGGAYTHSSIALMDAIAGIDTPVVEVHISNIHARENFREHSYSASQCIGVITGFGLKGYAMAIDFFLNKDQEDL